MVWCGVGIRFGGRYGLGGGCSLLVRGEGIGERGVDYWGTEGGKVDDGCEEGFYGELSSTR